MFLTKSKVNLDAAANMYNQKNQGGKKSPTRSRRRGKRNRSDKTELEAEEAAEQRDREKVYDSTRQLCGEQTVQSIPVKDKKGMVLIKTDDQPNLVPFHGSERDKSAMADVNRALKS